MVIRMAEYGTSLSTREIGRRAYRDIDAAIRAAESRVVLDFTGVRTVTNSFADEVFGRLVYEQGRERLRERTTFRGISSVCALSVSTAMKRREAMPA